MQAEIDSDGDGVLDAIDECPETPPNVVVDAKGCKIIIEGGDALEMEFRGFFLPMSSQLPDIYDTEFIKMAEKINEYPEASVFVFGHAATNEIDEDAVATFGFGSLSRNRALSIKNTLVLQHHIDAKRIRTYECSNKLLVRETDYINPSFNALNMKGLEAKQRRATLMASSEVIDLMNLEYNSDIQRYGEYAKHCKPFK
ncbi:OmpA family protein [Psychrobacter sp. AOP22-C1-22]|uniref:OmpA family protein n=1 Tax=unclassified Psychrobacter TaxID=196806 RepID=UPI001788006B|nr:MULTISPECIES: OmpA family protein [unclassified Psychrobacter]MBE0406802.1 OmpA family protein [Psychrobacter sp. FME6]MBE0444783.1 OmpA family protein [Psychrobacter sp. FME5]